MKIMTLMHEIFSGIKIMQNNETTSKLVKCINNQYQMQKNNNAVNIIMDMQTI